MKFSTIFSVLYFLLVTIAVCSGSDCDELFRLIEEANDNDTMMLNENAFNKEKSQKGWEKVKVFLQSKTTDELLDISVQAAERAANRSHLNEEQDKEESAYSYVGTVLAPLALRKNEVKDCQCIFNKMKREKSNPYWLVGISSWFRIFLLKCRLPQESKALILPKANDTFKTIVNENGTLLTQRQKESIMVIWLDILIKTFREEAGSKMVQEILKSHPDNLKAKLYENKNKIDKHSLAIMLDCLSNATVILDALAKHFTIGGNGLDSPVLQQRLLYMQELSIFDKSDIEKYKVLMPHAKGRK